MNTDSRAAHRPQIVVMGVSGSGKSTIGERVAELYGVRFIDGDALHSAANVEKMSAGLALTDDDRWPWLAKVGRVLRDAGERGEGLVTACSALKRSYRDAILDEAPEAVFIELSGSREVLEQRMSGRSGHFMPTTLLDSQLETLENLDADEPGDIVNIDGSVDEVVDAVRQAIDARVGHSAR